MILAGAPESVKQYLGFGLIPQAGVAIGLVFVVQDDPVLADISQLFLAVGITAVAINEIIGPITTRFAVKRSGEAGEDAPGLIDFLEPGHILTDLGAVTMQEAVGRLAAHLIQSHETELDPDAFLENVLAELDRGAYFGRGLAIPHAIVDARGEVLGVMGISREGLDLPTADGEPVHCVVLLATPSDQRDRHLEIVAAFVKAIGADRTVEQSLYAARDPQHAFALLHAVDETDMNELLERLDAP